MDSIFKISRSGTYGILIEGLEKDNSEYLNEETNILISTRNYAYSHTVTLNTISYLSSTGTETFDTYGVNKHINAIDTQEFTFSKDGLYKVSHIILPNQIWLAYVLERDPQALNEYSHIYYYNTTLDKFFIYSQGTSTQVTIAEILDAEYVDKVLVTDLVTTVIRLDKNTFIMYFLNECFNKLCKDLLLSLPQNCNINSQVYKQGMFNRDLLWMGINVIKYCLEQSQLYEAQRYLEEISKCDVLCNNSLNNSTYGCGCNN